MATRGELGSGTPGGIAYSATIGGNLANGTEAVASIDLTGRSKINGVQAQNTEQDIIVAGDSGFVFGDDFFTVLKANLATAITFDGTKATVAFTSHGLQTLQKIYVLNAAQDEFCGEKVATRIDANNFSFPCSLPVGTIITMPDNGYGGETWTGVTFNRMTSYPNCNAFFVANALLGHPFNVVRNCALNSVTAKQLKATAVRDILSHPAPWVVTTGGANEVRVASQSVDVAVAATKDYLLTLVNGADGYPGKKVIYQAWQPLTPGSIVGLQTIQFNHRIAEWCASVGIIFVDRHAALIDPTSTNGQALANVLAQVDGVHDSAASGELSAQAHLAAWQKLVVPRRILPTSAAESIANDAASKQMYRNPLLLTATGGSVSTLTGTAAANVTITATGGSGTASVVARTSGAHGDAYGNAQRVVVTGAANSEVQVAFTFTAGDFTTGDEIFGALAVDATGVNASNLTFCGCYLEIAAGTTRYFGDMKYGNGLGTDRVLPSDFRKVMVTPKAIINQAPSSVKMILWLKFSAAGGAVTIDAGRPALFKV